MQSGGNVGGADGMEDGAASGSSGFGSTLERALQDVVHSGHEADAKAVQSMSGEGNITEVVMAVSRAQLALQSTVAIRDKVVQGYQDIMKMSI